MYVQLLYECSVCCIDFQMKNSLNSICLYFTLDSTKRKAIKLHYNTIEMSMLAYINKIMNVVIVRR